MKDKLIELLKTDVELLIISLDNNNYPNLSLLEKLYFIEDNFYFVFERKEQLIKNLKDNSTIVIYLKSDQEKISLSGKAKILKKNKKEEVIEQFIKSDNQDLEIIKIKKPIIKSLLEEEKTRTEENLSNLKYRINKKCKSCNKCYKACPYDAITKGKKQYKIDPDKCINCGLCYKACPYKAIDKPIDLK